MCGWWFNDDRSINLSYASSLQVVDGVRARDVLAEPDLAVANGDLDGVLAVEHQADECLALEDDPAVHGRRAPRRLLHQNTDDAVAPLAAFQHLHLHLRASINEGDRSRR